MKKLSKLLSLVPMALTTVTLPVVVTSCGNKGGETGQTYTVSYGSTPDGLTFTQKPTSVKKGESLSINYTIANGYEINTVGSVVKCGNKEITSACSISSTTLTIPSTSITDNLVINLATESATSADYSISYSTTPDGLTWETKPTSASKNKSVTITYSLANNYSINTSDSKITVGGDDIISQIGTYNSGSITIPGTLVKGNIVISLVTKKTSSHTVTYGAKPEGLEWISNPTTATDGAMFKATYSLTNKEINTTKSSITIKGIEQKTNITYARGTIIIPADMVIGDIIINLVTQDETVGEIKSADNTATITPTASSITGNTIQTITPNTSADADVVNVSINGTLSKTQIVIDDSVSTKAYTYNITLNDCAVSNDTSTDEDSENPFMILKNSSYKSTFNIILADGTDNSFYDKRTGTDYANDVCFQSKSTGDITIKGNGALSINNINGYKGSTVCKGIQTKSNLTISNSATLNVFAYDTAIQVGGILTIDTGYVGADSYNDDAIKTKFEDPEDDLPLAGTGNIKRDIIIKGNSIVKAYAARTGINAAHDLIISGAPTIDVYTTKTYANADGTIRVNPSDTLDEQNMYIAIPSSLIDYSSIESYYYTIDFYNSSKSKWNKTEIMTLKKIRKDDAYYFFKCDRPLDSKYTQFRINKYAVSEYGKESPTAIATSAALTISSPASTSTNDCAKVTSIETSTKVIGTQSSTFDCNYNVLKDNDPQKSTPSIDTTISSKGLKAKNDISISSGTINVQSGDTCISASYGDMYCNTSSGVTFGTGNITITGGTITGTSNESDGIKAYGEMNVSGGVMTITKSVEALEAGVINISGGEIVLSANDDGLNASQTGKYKTSMVSLNISGGILDVQTTTTKDTDAVDSNNTLSITGGLIIARVPGSDPSSSLDWENGSVTIKNATIVLMGPSEKGKTLSGGTSYTVSGINSKGQHTVTYYISSGTTSSYTFKNSTAMNSTIIVRANLGKPTFK